MTHVPFSGPEALHADWGGADLLTLPLDTDRYRVGFAHSSACLTAAQRLRYEVFNMELGEGLSDAENEGLDRDSFDGQMTHLVLLDRSSDRVAGTYRLQRAADAAAGLGFYSAREFDLKGLGPCLPEAVELGRACLAKGHRNFEAIALLWQGIGAYMNAFGLHYAFGCSSITSRDPADGWRAMAALRRGGYMHAEMLLPVREAYRCGEATESPIEAMHLPKLFRTYLRLGAQVVSEPAIDGEFGTVDFLTWVDGRTVNLSQLVVST